MAVSALPALIDALVVATGPALPDWNVYDGIGLFGISSDPGDTLMIGVDDPMSPNPLQAASAQQDWAGTGQDADRDEEGDITCAAFAWNGDGDQKAARDAVYGAAETLAGICRNNPSLGLPTLLWTSLGTSADLTQNQDNSGASALLVFQIHYRARI